MSCVGSPASVQGLDNVPAPQSQKNLESTNVRGNKTHHLTQINNSSPTTAWGEGNGLQSEIKAAICILYHYYIIIIALKHLKMSRPMLYVIFSCALILFQMFTKVLKSREIHIQIHGFRMSSWALGKNRLTLSHLSLCAPVHPAG